MSVLDGWMRCILLYILPIRALILMHVMQGVILLAGDHLFFTPEVNM